MKITGTILLLASCICLFFSWKHSKVSSYEEIREEMYDSKYKYYKTQLALELEAGRKFGYADDALREAQLIREGINTSKDDRLQKRNLFLGFSAVTFLGGAIFLASPMVFGSSRNSHTTVHPPNTHSPTQQHANLSTSVPDSIFLLHNEDQKGPYSQEQINNMWLNGNITNDYFYWHEGMLDWEPILNLIKKY